MAVEILLFTFKYSNTYYTHKYVYENIPFHITKVTPYRFSTLLPPLLAPIVQTLRCFVRAIQVLVVDVLGGF